MQSYKIILRSDLRSPNGLDRKDIAYLFGGESGGAWKNLRRKRGFSRNVTPFYCGGKQRAVFPPCPEPRISVHCPEEEKLASSHTRSC